MSVDSKLGRGQRHKSPPVKYKDDDYMMVNRGRKKKAKQPRHDKEDVVYDTRGEDVCCIKYGTTPERLPLWIDLIKTTYLSVAERLSGGHGTQIKLLAKPWKGTVIELYNTGIIFIKGKKGTFVSWAEQEFPSLRLKLPPLGCTGCDSSQSHRNGKPEDSIVIEELDSEMGLKMGNTAEVREPINSESETDLKKVHCDTGVKTCDNKSESHSDVEKVDSDLSVKKLDEVAIQEVKTDIDPVDSKKNTAPVEIHKLLGNPDETPRKEKAVLDFGRPDIYIPSSTPLTSTPKTPIERNSLEIETLKNALRQMQSCIAEIPLLRRMLEDQKKQKEEEAELRRQNSSMTKQISHLKGLLEERVDETPDKALNIKEKKSMKSQIFDLEEQLRRKDMTIAFLERQVEKCSGNLPEKSTLMEKSQFSALKEAIESNKLEILDVNRQVKSLVDVQQKTIKEIVKAAVEEGVMLNLPKESGSQGVKLPDDSSKADTELKQVPGTHIPPEIPQNNVVQELHQIPEEENVQEQAGIQEETRSTTPTHKRDSTFLIRPATKNIVISDSMYRDVREMVIDPSGKTQVKTFGGDDTVRMANKLGSFQRNTQIADLFFFMWVQMRELILRQSTILKICTWQLEINSQMPR